MRSAPVIVSRLLEDGETPPPEDPLSAAKDFILQTADDAEQRKRAAHVTPENAMTANRFYHRTRQYARGGPYEARRNGRTKTWKTRPGEFSIPIKIGFKGHGTIDHTNAHEWAVSPDFAL